MVRTANPALNSNTFTDFTRMASGENQMTIQGTINKSGILLALVFIAAAKTWQSFFSDGDVMRWVGLGTIGGFILALVTVFKKNWAVITAPLYAVCQGFFLGGISSMLEAKFPGIVIQAVGLTIGTALALLLAYKTRLIKPTENFKLGLFAATGGICLLYLLTFVLSFFGIQMSFIHQNGPLGIGISAVIVVVAALNLVLDFDFIENGSARGVPKFMEWYAAFGLLVTLIWLYIEILHLLTKLRSRN